MWLLKKIIDLVLYGNYWIALGALALTLQTKYILGQTVAWDYLVGFVFFSTWLLYALHRIVGILRMGDFLDIERYSVIAKFRSHIIFYAVIATIGTAWYFFHLSTQVQIAVVIPGFFSLAYVLPFFGKRKRLRDFNQLKIYLVAFVWAWVTVLLPAVHAGEWRAWSLFFMFSERVLFVFAITLPFDIRDLIVDRHSEVITIPAIIGAEQTRLLALGLLASGFGLVFINWYIGYYTMDVFVGLMISFVSTGFLIQLSSVERHDYFYSGLMDGTMVFQGFLIGLAALSTL